MSQDKMNRLEWETDIPLFTNPFIWVDFLKALAVPFFFLGTIFFFILAADSHPNWGGAAGVLALCAGIIILIFIFVEIAVLRNRLRARFALDEKGLYYESGMKLRGAQKAGVIAGALIGCGVMLAILPFAALATLVESGRPIWLLQTRLGQGGRVSHCS